MKKYLPFFVGCGLMCMSYTTSKFLSNPNAPTGRTGAPKALVGGSIQYCTNCHADFALNTAGGSVAATGLPTGTYTAGQVYNFSLKITHSAADKVIWGFAIKAVNTVNNDVTGTFSTTNANASVKGSLAASTLELSNANAATTAATNNYTYLNLKWTAPSVPTANETNIRFYIVGLAGDGSGDETGDYVYSTTVNASVSVLPVTLNSFNLKSENDHAVNINWQTGQEINTAYFELETSVSSSDWFKISTIPARGNSASVQSYSFVDKTPPAFNTNIYYRLKIIDKDGSYKYSSIESVMLKNTGVVVENLSTQPLLPGKNGLFKIQSNTSKNMNIAVTDMNGRLLYHFNTTLSNGSNTIEIPGAKMAGVSGMVLIRFTADGFEKTFKQLIN